MSSADPRLVPESSNSSVPMPTPLLKIDAFAGIICIGDDRQFFGDALPFTELPKRAVRRLSKLEKGVASVLMGLGERVGDTPVVYTSRYGAIANSLGLLKTLVAGEAPSPTAFSLSVHNAAIGQASQLATNKGGHTALAAGPDSLIAGAIETWCRLREGDPQIVYLFSDCKMADEYEVFSNENGDVQCALIVSLEEDASEGETATTIGRGEFAAEALLRAIASGARTLTWEA